MFSLQMSLLFVTMLARMLEDYPCDEEAGGLVENGSFLCNMLEKQTQDFKFQMYVKTLCLCVPI
ncbi:hypothetical protein HanIR_Chr08g0358151 [Helianthus annuus]|nr:hypothetical protein HanIR_Chr08g0358151 [Helianthus annuus]